MLIYKTEKEMPFSEVVKDEKKGIVHHLVCNGSRRHVCYWDAKGQHCSVPNCEINHRAGK